MKNRCENNARKSDAKMTENGAKMEPKGGAQIENNLQKNACKKRCRNLTPKRDARRCGAGEVGGSILGPQNTKKREKCNPKKH